MKHYEIVLIIHPDRSDQIGSMIDYYSNIISLNGGVIHRLEDWGRRQLAYPIKKLHKAHYILMNIEIVHKTLSELEHDFHFNDSIIRNMILRMKNAIIEASPMMKSKESENSKQVLLGVK